MDVSFAVRDIALNQVFDLKRVGRPPMALFFLSDPPFVCSALLGRLCWRRLPGDRAYRR